MDTLYRPNAPAMDEIEAILERLQELEEEIAALKKRLNQLPSLLAEQLKGEEERLCAARYLYWLVPEISSKRIAQDLLGIRVHELGPVVGPIQSHLRCQRCNAPIPLRNRTHAVEIRRQLSEGWRLLCSTCYEEEKWQREKQAYEKRLRELRSMPYQEYLKTPEWQARRERHLRAVGYRCQLCNVANVPLEVHHRPYERRGEELFTDLLALCPKCHSLFHKLLDREERKM
jgi:hypothetical protein